MVFPRGVPAGSPALVGSKARKHGPAWMEHTLRMGIAGNQKDGPKLGTASTCVTSVYTMRQQLKTTGGATMRDEDLAPKETFTVVLLPAAASFSDAGLSEAIELLTRIRDGGALRDNEALLRDSAGIKGVAEQIQSVFSKRSARPEDAPGDQIPPAAPALPAVLAAALAGDEAQPAPPAALAIALALAPPGASPAGGAPDHVPTATATLAFDGKAVSAAGSGGGVAGAESLRDLAAARTHAAVLDGRAASVLAAAGGVGGSAGSAGGGSRAAALPAWDAQQSRVRAAEQALWQAQEDLRVSRLRAAEQALWQAQEEMRLAQKVRMNLY